MQYTISVNLLDRTATIVRYVPGRIGPVRRETHHDLTGPSARRLLRLCRMLTPLKVHKANGFYVFAQLGGEA